MISNRGGQCQRRIDVGIGAEFDVTFFAHSLFWFCTLSIAGGVFWGAEIAKNIVGNTVITKTIVGKIKTKTATCNGHCWQNKNRKKYRRKNGN